MVDHCGAVDWVVCMPGRRTCGIAADPGGGAIGPARCGVAFVEICRAGGPAAMPGYMNGGTPGTGAWKLGQVIGGASVVCGGANEKG